MATKKTNSSSKPKTTKKPVRRNTAAPKAVHKKATSAPTARKTVSAGEPYHPIFGVILLIVCAIMVATLLVGALKDVIDATRSDAMRFVEKYSQVDADNVFKLKSLDDTIDVIEHGTGIVFLGFPSCPWCQAYAPMLNDLAKEYGIKEIYYYDIKDERENNTESYQKLVSFLSDYLQYDKSGNKRIYVPETVFVIDGTIIGNDHETSKDTLGLENPEEYWTENRISEWKQRVGALMEKIKSAEDCTDSCNEEE